MTSRPRLAPPLAPPFELAALFLAALAVLPACDGASTDTTGAGGAGGAGASTNAGGADTGGSATTGPGGAGGGTSEACAPTFSDELVHLAAGDTLDPGDERSLCLRWTTPEPLNIHKFQGTLGPALGHHALLLGQQNPTEPDGLAPCSEAELMDAQKTGGFSMLAGVSYESDGVAYELPSAPVQVGLFVPAGTQLIFDAHFINATAEAKAGCASIDLHRGKPVVAKLQFRTVLPVEQYALSVPAQGKVDVTYEEPAGGKYRIAAASSHMHEGGTHFRMSIKETGQTLYETTGWAEPQPAIFDTKKIVLEETQTLQLECSFENPTASPQKFPQQMCVGGMYLLPCSLPGAC